MPERPPVVRGGIIGPYGTMLPAWAMVRERAFFPQTLFFENLVGGAQDNDGFPVQGDADWILTALTGVATDPAAPETEVAFVPVTIMIRDTGSGRNLMNEPAHFETLFGDGRQPFPLPSAYVVDRNSNIEVTVVNLSAGTDVDLRLNFIGFKVFDYVDER